MVLFAAAVVWEQTSLQPNGGSMLHTKSELHSQLAICARIAYAQITMLSPCAQTQTITNAKLQMVTPNNVIACKLQQLTFKTCSKSYNRSSKLK